MQGLIPFPWPQANEVHIHCVSHSYEAKHYVSSDERLTADRLLDLPTRNRYIACRGLLREILGRYLKIPPQELNFAVGEHGKPYLSANAANINRLHFNLSHSGALFLLAIAADREVGIDVERLRKDTPFPAMARLTFSPHEQKELFALPGHLQRSAFFRCWTRKEAYLKACGMGFDLPSNSFDVSLLPESPASMTSPGDLSRWLLQDISVPEEYCAALAVKGSNLIIRYID